MKRKTGLKVRDVAKDHFSSGLSNTVPNFSRLVITFLEGKSLLASDVETGKSDPVCFVWCGPIDETPDLSDSSEENENGILKTKVCPTTTDPIWNEDIVFPIELSDIASLSSLKCSIYCRDEDISETGDVTYDELGMIELPFKEILSRGKSLKNSIVISASWYTLKASPGMRRVDGKIKLTINLIIDNSDFENVSNQLLQQGATTPNTSITQQLQNMHKSIDLSATGAGPVSGETLLNTVRSSAGFSTSLNSARPRPSSASPTRGRMSNQWETGSAAGSNTARSTSRERGRSLKNNKNAMTIGSAVIKTKRPSTAPLMSSVPEFVGANSRYSNLQSTDNSVDMDGRSEMNPNEMYSTADSVLSETERSEDYTVEDEDEEEELFVIPKHQNKKSHKKHLAKRPYTAEYETIPEEISPRTELDTERGTVRDTARDTIAGDTVKDTARSTVKSAGRSVVSGTAANKIRGEADGERADDPQEQQEGFDFNLPKGDEGVMDDVMKMGMNAASGAVQDILAEGQIQNIAASVSQLVAAKVTDAKAITHMLKENISEATKKNSQNVANFVTEQSTGSNLSNIGSSVGNALQEMAKSVSSIKAPQIAYNEVSARLLDGLKAVGDDVLESTLVEKMNDKIKSITAPKSKLVGGAAGAAARATAKQTGSAHSVDSNNEDDADTDTVGTDIPVEKANKRKTVERTLIPPREEDAEDGHENESIGEIISLKPSLGVADPKQTRARTGSTSTTHSLARSASKEMTTQEFDSAAVPRSSSRDRGDSRSVARSEQSRTTAGTRDGREGGTRPASGKKSSGTAASGSGAVDNSNSNNRRLSSSTKNTTSASTLFGDGPARGDQSMAPDMWDDEVVPGEKYQSRVPVPPLKLSSEPRVKPAPRPVQQEPHEHKQRSRSQQPVEQQQQQQRQQQSQQRRSRSPQSRSKPSSSQSKHRPVPSQYSETDVEAEEYYSMDEDRERAERGLQRSASMTGSTTSVIRALKEMNQGRVVMEKSLQELTNITKQGLSNLSDRITKIEEAATSNPLNMSPSRGDQSMPPEADDPKAKSTTKQSRLKSAIAKVATTKSVTSRWDASPLRTSSPKRTSTGAAGGGAATGTKQSDVEGFKRAQKKYMYNSNNYASSLEDLLPPVEKKPPAPVEPEITIMYRTDDGRIAAAINSPSRQQATENYQDDYARAPRVRSRDKQLQLQNPDNSNNNNNNNNNNNGNQNYNSNGNGGGGGNGGGYAQPHDNRTSQDNQNHPPSNNNNGNSGNYNQPPGASPMHFNNNNGNNMGGNNYGGPQDNKSRINTDFPELDSNNVYHANSPDRPLQATLNHPNNNNNIGAAAGVGGYNAGYNNYNGGNGGNSNQNTGNLGAVFPPYEDNRASRDVLKAYNNGSSNNNNIPLEAPPTFSNSANIGNALGYSGNFGNPVAPAYAPPPHSPVHITSDLKPKINRDFCEVLDRGTLEDIVLLMQTTGPKPELLAPSTRNRLYDSIATLLHQRKHTERCLVWVLVLVRSQENLLATMAGHSKRDLVESLGKATTEPGKRGQLASLLRSQIIKQME